MHREFVSFPKSGRSWVRYALTHIGVAQTIHFHHDGFEFSDAGIRPLDLDFEGRLLRCTPDRRVVYMRRDPRDVMVSFYHQITGRMQPVFDFRGDLASFLRDPYFGAHQLRAFTRQWDEICARGLALEIRYEDCAKDLASVLRRVLSHYELPVDESAIAAACEAARFERMKAVEDSDSFEAPWLRRRNGAPKMRRGVVGGYRSELADVDLRYLESLFELASDAADPA